MGIACELDDCLIGWLFNEPYEIPSTSNVEKFSLKPFYETSQWLSRQIFNMKISENEIAEKICRVVTVDQTLRSPLFYVPAEFVPRVVKEGAKYLASKDISTDLSEHKSKFLNSVTPNGVSALVAAVACGDKNKVQALIDEGANRSVSTSDVHKWGVLHFVVKNFAKFSKVQELVEILLKGANDYELDNMLLSPSSEHTPLMLAVSIGRDEEITSFFSEKTISRSIQSLARCDKEKNCVLHLAANDNGQKYYVNLINNLLAHSSANPCKENARGYTASEISLENVLSIWSNVNQSWLHSRYKKSLVQPRSISKEFNKYLKGKMKRRTAFGLLEGKTTDGRIAIGFHEVKMNANDAAKSARDESEKPREIFVKTTSND